MLPVPAAFRDEITTTLFRHFMNPDVETAEDDCEMVSVSRMMRLPPRFVTPSTVSAPDIVLAPVTASALVTLSPVEFNDIFPFPLIRHMKVPLLGTFVAISAAEPSPLMYLTLVPDGLSIFPVNTRESPKVLRPAAVSVEERVVAPATVRVPVV
jgi:hypothetical protein